MQMNFVLQPWQMLLLIVAGWMNRQQQTAIEYLRTENSVLREKLGRKRILLNDNQRRRLAVKGRVLGRERLKEIGTLFTVVAGLLNLLAVYDAFVGPMILTPRQKEELDSKKK